MTDWQPIRTAPKDRRFLGFLQDRLSAQIEICVWSRSEGVFLPIRHLHSPRLWSFDVGARDVTITHWMPLPDPFEGA